MSMPTSIRVRSIFTSIYMIQSIATLTNAAIDARRGFRKTPLELPGEHRDLEVWKRCSRSNFYVNRCDYLCPI
jgi:hypothetical protein